MPTFAEGSYDSFEQVIRAVDTLVMRGHEKEDMKIVVGQSSALEKISDPSGINVVEYSSVSSNEESSVLTEYKQQLKQGEIVLLVNEAADEDKEQSVDAQPDKADRANERSASGSMTSTDNSQDAEMIDDLKSSDTDVSGNSNNDDLGVSSDLNVSTEDSDGGRLDRSI
ncbi:general stress protein [Alkalibacterium olivapovliticus]|uniref:Heat induced stress protein YflT n=1 Tax=Alkalibacterium olivapovliticus TaxID=99907 RepID=A0A2T0WA78_9LACT|nr:general stress protein [Alkalibacterium olivapovliticus]PRY83610.1 heat induced stress protein YflT [Alkalibacterium olivapovliticus]